ncbi:MAG: TRAP transporter small permease [Desulfobacterium sp.]|nr:TRAP transporter small permease [Desulfobacterium sp.]
MICHECGKEVEDDTRICPICYVSLLETGSFFDKIAKIEGFFLSACLAMMVIMVLLQIFLRNFFSSGIAGGDAIVRHLLLWVGFLGAGLATRGGMHIRVDIASKILSQKGMRVANVFTDFFSVIVGCFLVYASFSFVKLEYQSADKLLFMHLPIWAMESIIPIGFLIITLRFASKGIERIFKLVKET